jgi:hypothetical protein
MSDSTKAGKVFTLIPKIMGEVGAIEKSRNNEQQRYKFRGIDDVYAALQPLLSKHGVFYAPKVLEMSREEKPTKNGGMMMTTLLTVKFTFFADDGSSVEVVTVGEAMDSGDKSANKAMSAALKYAAFQVFCIPTKEEAEDDIDNHAPERAQPAPRATVPRVAPGIPGPNDGNTRREEYRIPFGKYAQRSLDEVDLNELRSYVAYLEDQAATSDKPMRADAKEFVERATRHIVAIERGP